jgi:hypothetical protein
MSAQPQTDETLARRELIAQLFGAFGRTPTEANYAGYEATLKLMTTPMLARVVSSWLEKISEATDPEELRVPTAGKLWQLRRKLRALPTPPLVLHGAPEVKQDAWDTAANSHLLNYITSGLVQSAVHGQKPARNANRYAPDSRFDSVNRCVIPGDLTRKITAVLVKWKNAWARDMREDRELYDGKLEGKAFWQQCMASAEGEIDQLLRAIAA